MSQLVISEIFGPTIQGEGALVGKPTVFVRSGGCDYRCRWCDTLYAVEKKYRPEWQTLSTAAVWERIQTLSPTPILITLSGGNPALQDFAELIATGHAAGYDFAMETQGSIAKSWFSHIDYLTLSPKPPSSGMKTRWELFERCVSLAKTPQAISIKLVIADTADFNWAWDVRQRYPQFNYYLQPCNLQAGEATLEQNLQSTRELIEQVVAAGWHQATVLPQLHNLLWGNQRGV
ncbi:MAG: 7-carboxy-7-deazaguanine synthase QueE [Proteobacteria bacterium]|nr:MAG: 7-carboxy-7-deazaguanine synthase QueE [Pseudomonadota bacterium]